MKLIISFLLHTIMVITAVIGTITEVNSSQLESKILNGRRAKEAYKYMASLQLDSKHICSSGMFQTGYLLTTLDCALLIEKGILIKMNKGTAVLGSSKLTTGQRVDIERIRYTSQGKIFSYHVGIIKLAPDVNYTNVESLDLYSEPIDLRFDGSYAMVCGWGSVKSDDQEESFLGNASSSKNLHCMYLSLASVNTCRPAIQTGDFRTKLICGVAENQEQATTWGDVGSPLIKIIKTGDKEKEYIVGVTLNRHIGKNSTFLRFIRSSFIFPNIKELTRNLDSSARADLDCIRSNEQESRDKQYKRRKYE